MRAFYLIEIEGPLLTFNGNLYVSNRGVLFDDSVTAKNTDYRLMKW